MMMLPSSNALADEPNGAEGTPVTSWSVGSTKDIAGGSIVKLTGATVTLGGTDMTWGLSTATTDNAAGDAGVCSRMVNDGTNAISSFSTTSPYSTLPTSGAFLKIVATADGNITITGKESSNASQKIIFVTTSDGSTITNVQSNDKESSSNSKARQYAIENGKTYYFFQLAYSTNITSYRYTLQSLAFSEPEAADPAELTTINGQTVWDFEKTDTWSERSTTTAAGAVYDNLWLSGTCTYNSTDGYMELAAGTTNRMKFKVASGQKGYVVIIAKGSTGPGYGLGSNAVVGSTSTVCTGSIYKVYTSQWNNADTDKDVLIHAPTANVVQIKKIAWIPAGTSSTANATFTLGTAGFSTFCPTTTVTIPTGLKAYILNSCNGTTTTWGEISSTIPAFAGVLLVGEGGTDYTFYPKNSDGVIATGPTSDWYDNNNATTRHNILVGTYENTSIPASTVSTSYYGLVKNTSTFGLVTANVTMAAGLAYFSVEGSNNAREIKLNFNDSETTSISEECRVKSEESAAASVFNLAGQLITQPSKGLYIVNGKKVIVK